MAFRCSEHRGPPKGVLSAEGTIGIIGSFDVSGGQTRGACPEPTNTKSVAQNLLH